MSTVSHSLNCKANGFSRAVIVALNKQPENVHSRRFVNLAVRRKTTSQGESTDTRPVFPRDAPVVYLRTEFTYGTYALASEACGLKLFLFTSRILPRTRSLSFVVNRTEYDSENILETTGGEVSITRAGSKPLEKRKMIGARTWNRLEVITAIRRDDVIGSRLA